MEPDGVDNHLLNGLSLHRRQPSSPTSPTSLSHAHISEALLKSEDNGETLDFSHKGLTDVGESGAEQLATIGREDLMEDESSVLRITVASNRLAALPMAFALLSRLRYLNLKNNCFTVFPDVLTVMPSLEILDIGRNKLKRLPTQPGSLVNLRVFSFYKNKITRLPLYLTKFTRLTILRAEQNPWEWPPKSVMETQSTSKDFIKVLQRWIDENALLEHRKLSTDTSLPEETEQDSERLDFDDLETLESEFDNRPTPHARSFSVSSATSVQPHGIATPLSSLSPSRSDRPSPLPLSSLSFGRSVSPPSRSPDTYLPTPDESIGSSTDDDTSKPSLDSLAHARNASYAGSSRAAGRPSLSSKKSLPDLRPIKLPMGHELPPRSPTAPLWDGHIVNRSVDQLLSSTLRQDSSSSSDSAPPNPRLGRAFLRGDVASSPVSMNRPAPPMDGERHSYFRRFSVLQSASLSRTIPESLLRLVDAARGILFAVSQIYQTLQHYTVYAIDERLASVLLKVLDPASTYITQLINALDRFDSMSRRTLPTPLICRGVVEGCKDNVAIFGKAVGVLALQLKVLATQDDVRYTRQMLLVLYGATAEISHAWQSMVPHLEAVGPLLRDHRPPPVAKTRPVQNTTHPTLPTTPTSAPPAASSFQSHRSPLVPPESPVPAERTHIARRHAGSFSSKDVEIGRFMPSADEPTPLPRGVIAGIGVEVPIPRFSRRQPGLLPLYSGSTLTTSLRKNSQSPHDNHSRQGSQSSLVGSSASSSPLTVGRSVEMPTALDSLVDKEAIDAMIKAVEAAPPVWTMMDNILADVGENQEEIKDTLVRAHAVTRQLKSDISALQDGAYVDRKSLRNDAHLFVKLVVFLSTNVKSYVDTHPLSSTLRTYMVKLTNATEEFVILLHVSSFSTPTTTRPHTPLVNALSSNSAVLGGPVSDDTHLSVVTSLSRSRSALTSSSRTLVTTATRDVPHSALPQQSFRVPPIPHRLKATTPDNTLDVF
ncbi:RAM signaling pathway protein-domain-containing protein [Gloeopeniophorella convolvens]|nr:RAM signaling pathway protein-domain-containing protein [Gloeopeniophorella convolvens]